METNAVEFLATMRQLWTVHGMGTLTLDFGYRQHGLIIVTTENSVLTMGSEIGLQSGTVPWHQLQAGFIAAWFSRWAGKDIFACATDWSPPSSADASENSNPSSQGNFTRFIVGATSTVQQVELWVKKGMRTAEVVEKLVAQN